MSEDYMRPQVKLENSKYYNPVGEMLPQHRPIDVSKYLTGSDSSPIVEPIKQEFIPVKPATETDELMRKVEQLKALDSAENLLNIQDNIKIEHVAPAEMPQPATIPLNVDEQTEINIQTHIPVVDIDKLVQEEEQKARQRAKSPEKYAPVSMEKMDSLQLPSASRLPTPSSQNESQLKRMHSPERQTSPTRTNKRATTEMDEALSGMQAEEVADKQTYSSRIKTFFSSKPKEPVEENMALPVRSRSPSPAPSTSRFMSMFSKDKSQTNTNAREKSPSPAPSTSRFMSMFSKEKTPTREKSPSPVPSKLMTMFSKEKPKAMQVISGTNATVNATRSDKELVSVKVVETFSLKVDEMDQYMAKPAKPIAPAASVPQSLGSHEDFSYSEQTSIAPAAEAFAPVIIGRATSSSNGFINSTRSLYNSEQEMFAADRGMQRQAVSREPSVHLHPELKGRPLFSAAILVGSSGSLGPQTASHSVRAQTFRSPSEQRPIPNNAAQFFDGRTQSQDRQGLSGSQDNISTSRMSKTVSFNFEERKSRLTDFENRALSQKQTNPVSLEKSYFLR